MESLISQKSAILPKIDKKISKLKTRTKSSKSNPILKQTDVISWLEMLRKTFVLVPVDKVSNNVTIICKRNYGEVILNKIGYNTYCKANKSCDENTEYTKCLGFERKKYYLSCTGLLRCIRIQHVRVSSLHLNHVLLSNCFQCL